MDLAKQAKIVDSIHDTLHDFVGQRLKVRANMGRSKIVESEGVLMQVHPQLFIMEVDRKRVGRGNNIKTSGKHAVEVNLYREITATVNVLVGVTEEEPAAEAAEAEADEAVEEVAEESAE